MDPYGKVFHILNKPLHYAYIALLMLCFILALGNRPQGCVTFREGSSNSSVPNGVTPLLWSALL